MTEEIDHEIKKPEMFTDRLQQRMAGFMQLLMDEIPELDAVAVGFVYNQALGDGVNPNALTYQRNAQDPILRARIARVVGQLALFVTNNVAAGFHEALETLKELHKELDATREAVKNSTRQNQTTP